MELDSKNIETLLQRLEKIGIEHKLIPGFMKGLANSLALNPNMNFTQVPDDYKIKSPFDNAVGWVSRSQVKRTLMQDDETFKPCK